jgi:hypothetical protein
MLHRKVTGEGGQRRWQSNCYRLMHENLQCTNITLRMSDQHRTSEGSVECVQKAVQDSRQKAVLRDLFWSSDHVYIRNILSHRLTEGPPLLSQCSVWIPTARTEFDPRQRKKVFSLAAYSVLTGSAAHPASCTMSTGGKSGRGVTLTAHSIYCRG